VAISRWRAFAGFIIHARVKLAPAFTLACLLLLCGCATTSPREALSSQARTVVLTGLEPVIYGVNVGTTVFQNRRWEAPADPFEVNVVAAAGATKVLTQPLPVSDAHTAGLQADLIYKPGLRPADETELARQLAAIGRTQKAERILLFTTGAGSDWIYNTNQPLKGVGLYRREVFGMRRVQVYGIVQLRVFDCTTEKFTASDFARGAREVYSIEWHDQWAGFSVGEQHRLVLAWTDLVNEQVGQLLTRAGLANVPLPEKSLAKTLLLVPDRPKSWLPEGNVLSMPPGVAPERARAAVVRGLKARGWTVVSEDDAQVVGIYRDGRKQAGVTAVLSPTAIELVPNDHEVNADGSMGATASYPRWQKNLKESIYRDLMLAEEAQLPELPATPAPSP
jgi:hypothetical protein